MVYLTAELIVIKILFTLYSITFLWYAVQGLCYDHETITTNG